METSKTLYSVRYIIEYRDTRVIAVAGMRYGANLPESRTETIEETYGLASLIAHPKIWDTPARPFVFPASIFYLSGSDCNPKIYLRREQIYKRDLRVIPEIYPLTIKSEYTKVNAAEVPFSKIQAALGCNDFLDWLFDNWSTRFKSDMTINTINDPGKCPMCGENDLLATENSDGGETRFCPHCGYTDVYSASTLTWKNSAN